MIWLGLRARLACLVAEFARIRAICGALGHSPEVLATSATSETCVSVHWDTNRVLVSQPDHTGFSLSAVVPGGQGGVPLSSVALDSAGVVAQVCARTGVPDQALSAGWPTTTLGADVIGWNTAVALLRRDRRAVVCAAQAVERQRGSCRYYGSSPSSP